MNNETIKVPFHPVCVELFGGPFIITAVEHEHETEPGHVHFGATFYPSFPISFYVRLHLTRFDSISLGYTRFDWAIFDFTRLHRVLIGST